MRKLVTESSSGFKMMWFLYLNLNVIRKPGWGVDNDYNTHIFNISPKNVNYSLFWIKFETIHI